MKLDLDKWRAELKKTESEIRALKKRINQTQGVHMNGHRRVHIVPDSSLSFVPVEKLIWELLKLKARANTLYCMRRAAKAKMHNPQTFWFFDSYSYMGRKNYVMHFNSRKLDSPDTLALKSLLPEFTQLLREDDDGLQNPVA